MTSIDSRIVTMKFDNAQFAKAAADTIGMLQKLGGAISGLSAVKALGSLSSSASKVDMTPIGTQIDGINAKFLALGTIAVTTLANITNKVVDAGLSLANSLTLAPIQTGLNEYETNLNSIQTILANTAAAGTKLRDVTGALDELNEYSDQTIYNFSEMARNIGTFTAAGVELDTAVGSIKGIANLAALSGSNSQQASTAMYQLSQAISAGRVSLMDWNSVVNAGMGGAVFQRALAQTAVAMGRIDDSAVNLEGAMKNVTVNGLSFRESISATGGGSSWLDGDVLTATLEQFTGDLSDAELAAQGFSKAQIAAIQEQADMAFKAATKVKSLTQLIDVAKETAQSGWAETWRYIFGDFREARRTFSAASYRVSGIIKMVSDARNRVLGDWADMGGRKVFIESISDAFKVLDKLLTPIRHAFRSVFEPLDGAKLFSITEAIGGFIKGLKASKDTMNDIRSVFKAVFGVIAVFVEVIQGALGYIFDFFGIMAGGTGGVLDLVASFADLVSGVTDFILKSDMIGNFFDGLTTARNAVLKPIVEFLSDILSVVGDIVRTGGDIFFTTISEAAQAAAPYLKQAGEYLEMIGNVIRDEVVARLERLEPTVERIKDSIKDFFGSFDGGGDKIKDALSFDVGGAASNAGGFFGGILESIKDFIPTMDEVKAGFSNFLDIVIEVGRVIGGALLAPFVLIGKGAEAGADKVGGFAGAIAGIVEAIGSFIGGIGGFIKDVLPSLNLQSIVAFINTVLVSGILLGAARMQMGLGKMASAFGGFADDLTDVVGKNGILGQLNSNMKSMQNNIRADTIMKIAIAIALLAASLYLLAQLDVKQIGKGLGAIAALMTILAGAVAVMMKGQRGGIAKQAAGMAAFSVAMVAMAGAITILAGAVALFGNMDTETLVKGVSTVAVIMGLFAGMAIALGKGGAVGALGVVAVSIAMGIMAASLIAFAAAIKKYDGIAWQDLLNGVAKIAVLLVALGLAMAFMNGGIGGAVALGILALSLQLLIPTLVELAEIGWGTILKGVAILAVALGILGAVAYVVGPALVVLGAGLLMMGIGMLAFGVGVAAFATGIATLAALGGTAALVLTAYIQAIISQIPLIAKGIGMAIEAIAQEFVEHRKDFEIIGVTLIAALANIFHKSRDKIRRAMSDLIRLALGVIVDNINNFINAGRDLVIGLLKGLADATPRLARQAWRVFKAFADAFEEYIPKMADRGAKMILEVLRGIREAIDKYWSQIVTEAALIGWAIIEGVVEGLGRYAWMIGNKLVSIAKDAWNQAKSFMGIASPSKLFADTVGAPIVQGIAEGIEMAGGLVDNEAEGVGTKVGKMIAKSMSDANASLQLDPNLSPTITPVLDLTQLTQEAGRVSSLFTDPSIGLASYSSAAQLSSDTEAVRAQAAETEPVTQTVVNFEQTNNSPKALSSVEIYRDTRSLMALAKEALK